MPDECIKLTNETVNIQIWTWSWTNFFPTCNQLWSKVIHITYLHLLGTSDEAYRYFLRYLELSIMAFLKLCIQWINNFLKMFLVVHHLLLSNHSKKYFCLISQMKALEISLQKSFDFIYFWERQKVVPFFCPLVIMVHKRVHC